jgi:hypothetical protein
LQPHLALVENVGVVGDVQRRPDVLLDDDDRDAVAANLLDAPPMLNVLRLACRKRMARTCVRSSEDRSWRNV